MSMLRTTLWMPFHAHPMPVYYTLTVSGSRQVSRYWRGGLQESVDSIIELTQHLRIQKKRKELKDQICTRSVA